MGKGREGDDERDEKEKEKVKGRDMMVGGGRMEKREKGKIK